MSRFRRSSKILGYPWGTLEKVYNKKKLNFKDFGIEIGWRSGLKYLLFLNLIFIIF